MHINFIVKYLLDNTKDLVFSGYFNDWLEPYMKYHLYGIEIRCYYFPGYSKIDKIMINNKAVPYSVQLEYLFEGIGQKYIHVE